MRPVSVLPLVVLAFACGRPSQVSFVSHERPTAQGAPETLPPAPQTKQAVAPDELPSDDRSIEPDRPAADTRQERALVHIHAADGGTCSGVVLAPRVVATAQQCVKGVARGVSRLDPRQAPRVELASSTLTWTRRTATHSVVPGCDWHGLDVALLVLDEAPPFAAPLRIIAAPSPGARVQALGFGHCRGDERPLGERTGDVRSRTSTALVIDVPLCRGDVGGPVVDGTGGDVFGLISRRDDPEGSPLRTTTLARLDTTEAKELLAQAEATVAGKALPTAVVACP